VKTACAGPRFTVNCFLKGQTTAEDKLEECQDGIQQLQTTMGRYLKAILEVQRLHIIQNWQGESLGKKCRVGTMFGGSQTT